MIILALGLPDEFSPLLQISVEHQPEVYLDGGAFTCAFAFSTDAQERAKPFLGDLDLEEAVAMMVSDGLVNLLCLTGEESKKLAVRVVRPEIGEAAHADS